MTHRLSLDRIAAAARTIDPVFLRSPLLHSEPIGELLGVELSIKVETVNPIRCFKGRGADNFVATADEHDPFICASAGNFGQAMAYACRKRELALTVMAAHSANPLKLDRMRALGARVLQVGVDFEAAKEAARQWARQGAYRFVEDGREPQFAEGAGTIAVELLDGRTFDAVTIPIGDGALITGMARWIKHAAPSTLVIGVCSRGATAVHDSWKRHEIVVHPTTETIADGIAVRTPVDVAVEDMHGIVDDIVLVDDDALIRAMRMVHEHAGLVAEPAAVAGIAAIATDRERFAKLRVATVLTGGNVTREQLHVWHLHAAS